MRVALLAPIDASPFALAVAELCDREPGVELSGIVVRRIVDLRRLRSELRLEGMRMVRKVWRKLGARQGAPGARGERGFDEVVGELGVAPRSLAAFARRRGIPHRRVSDHNSDEAIGLLRRLSPDVVVYTGGGLIRAPLLEMPRHGILNAHMGVLPAYRGLDTVEWPLLEGRAEAVDLGVTLHLMDAGVDTGPVVDVWHVPIRAGDTLERLRRRFEPVMVEAMLEGLRRIRDGRCRPVPQEPRSGRQYYLMHRRLEARARGRLAALAGP